jgi:PAS domain S-box-containing protein
MAIILLDGTIVKVNRRLRDLLGFEEGDLMGVPAETFAASSDADQATLRDELLETGVSHRRVTQLRRNDGSVFSAITSAVVAHDDQGKPRYVIACAAESEPGFSLEVHAGTSDAGAESATPEHLATDPLTPR